MALEIPTGMLLSSHRKGESLALFAIQYGRLISDSSRSAPAAVEHKQSTKGSSGRKGDGIQYNGYFQG